MRRIALVAGNYMFEQRWAILSLSLYAPGMALLLNGLNGADEETLTFFLRQQASFVVIFAMLFSGAAIYNDRRSRRILSILSKSVKRGEYVAGILMAVCTGIGLFVITTAASFLFSGPADAKEQMLVILVPAVFGMFAAAATSLFFSTFMHPMFSTITTGIFIGLPALFNHLEIHLGRAISPVYYILMQVTTRTAPAPYQLFIWCVIHTVIFWAAATIIFARRDIAISVD